jgi:very-short-patch-repair endonuclease
MLRAVLADYAGPTLTRLELEECFLALWRAEGLIVETDGRDVHTTRAAFEHDRLRDQRLTLAGFTVVRFTWRQVTGEPQRVLRTTRRLLARLARP